MSGVKSGRSHAFRIGDLLVTPQYLYVIVRCMSGPERCAAHGFDFLERAAPVWTRDEWVDAQLFPDERVVK